MRNIILIVLASLFIVTGAEAQWIKGFNARSTTAYCTDPTNSQFYGHVDGDSGTEDTGYPTINGGVTFGSTSNIGDSRRNRDSSVDCRLAGIVFEQNSELAPARIRVDLPAAGFYNFRLAMGDAVYEPGVNQRVRVYDNVTLKNTISGDILSTGRFIDASGVERTSAADWVANNQSIAINFASTVAYIEFGYGDGATANSTKLSHFSLEQLAGTPTPTPTATPTPTPTPTATPTPDPGTGYSNLESAGTDRYSFALQDSLSNCYHLPMVRRDTGVAQTGIAYNTPGFNCVFHRDTAPSTTPIVLVNGTVGTYISGGFKEITDIVEYQLCVPNAAFATGAKSVEIVCAGVPPLAPSRLHVTLLSDPAVGLLESDIPDLTGPPTEPLKFKTAVRANFNRNFRKVKDNRSTNKRENYNGSGANYCSAPLITSGSTTTVGDCVAP